MIDPAREDDRRPVMLRAYGPLAFLPVWLTLCTGLLQAAHLLVSGGTPALPRYQLRLQDRDHGDRTRLSMEATLRILLRPAVRVHGPVRLRAFLDHAGRVDPWPV